MLYFAGTQSHRLIDFLIFLTSAVLDLEMKQAAEEAERSRLETMAKMKAR